MLTGKTEHTPSLPLCSLRPEIPTAAQVGVWGLLPYLSRRLDSFGQGSVDNEPGQEEAAGQRPADVSRILDAFRDVQHIVPAGVVQTEKN